MCIDIYIYVDIDTDIDIDIDIDTVVYLWMFDRTKRQQPPGLFVVMSQKTVFDMCNMSVSSFSLLIHSKHRTTKEANTPDDTCAKKCLEPHIACIG